MHLSLTFLSGGTAVRRRGSLSPSPGRRAGAWLCTAVAVGLSFCAPASADPLIIGSVTDFKAKKTVTLGDKDFTYLGDSGWTAAKGGLLSLSVNANPLNLSHTFQLSQLNSYVSGDVMTLGYQVHVNGTNPGSYLLSALLSVDYQSPNVIVYKDIFTSFDDYEDFVLPGSGPGWHLKSTNGFPDTVPFSIPGLIDIWVRDTIDLSGGGRLNSTSDTFLQAVPEIDPNSFGTALATVIGSLSLLERRARRWLGGAVAA